MKIVASDFDGTLFFDGKISEEDMRAIEKFRRAGNKFGIVTGRDIDNGLIISRGEIFLPDFTVCCTGAIIMDGRGRIIYRKSAPAGEFFYDLIDKAADLGAILFMISDGFLKLNTDVWRQNKTDLSPIKNYTHANTWFKDGEAAEKFTRFVNEKYGDKISAFSNGLGVDMPPPGVSKITGIKTYAANFSSPEIYVAGDNLNDIAMIKEFGGFAVSNAVPEVKKAAKYNCNRIADMLETIMST